MTKKLWDTFETETRLLDPSTMLSVDNHNDDHFEIFHCDASNEAFFTFECFAFQISQEQERDGFPRIDGDKQVTAFFFDDS